MAPVVAAFAPHTFQMGQGPVWTLNVTTNVNLLFTNKSNSSLFSLLARVLFGEGISRPCPQNIPADISCTGWCGVLVLMRFLNCRIVVRFVVDCNR